jgi:hypothetical protein
MRRITQSRTPPSAFTPRPQSPPRVSVPAAGEISIIVHVRKSDPSSGTSGHPFAVARRERSGQNQPKDRAGRTPIERASRSDEQPPPPQPEPTVFDLRTSMSTDDAPACARSAAPGTLRNPSGASSTGAARASAPASALGGGRASAPASVGEPGDRSQPATAATRSATQRRLASTPPDASPSRHAPPHEWRSTAVLLRRRSVTKTGEGDWSQFVVPHPVP